MKCRKALKLILSYSELDPSCKRRLDEHLKSCPHCSSEFSLHQESINFVKETVSFQGTKDFWEDYQVNVSRRIPSGSLWGKAWIKVEGLACLFRTPVLGPVPAYIFSLAVIALLTVSLYPGFFSSRETKGFRNDLVPYELEVISTVDNGVETIYTFASK
jgi:anti-sigma factor RsiW